jgi:glutaredoxin
LCQNWFSASKLECDHIKASDGCYDFETAQKFLWHCAADDPDNWALVCRPCHKIKSHAERQGLSFEESRIEKEIIAIVKAKKDKSFLLEKGIVPASNAAKRKEQIREYLKENK